MRRGGRFSSRQRIRRWGQAGLKPDALLALRRANRLLEVGQHANAAFIFERLAREAMDHGFERQAPFFLLQAGRARLLAGEPSTGEALLREGLNVLARQGRWTARRRAVQRLIEDLRRLDQPGLARELLTSQESPSAQEGEGRSSPVPARSRLPLQCPHCGAPALEDEVEWRTGGAAECAYCGGLMRIES